VTRRLEADLGVANGVPGTYSVTCTSNTTLVLPMANVIGADPALTG
jgi:hypothetical protein